MSQLAIVYCRGQSGIDAPLVNVETHITGGLPKFNIVGLPEAVVKESRDRVRSAIINSQFEFPVRRITVNLAPADTPKEGGRFDLPIALGILAASRQIPANRLGEFEFAGELALSGALRAIKGALPFAIATRKAERQLILPEANSAEASVIDGLHLSTATHLLDVCRYLKGVGELTPVATKSLARVNEPSLPLADLADIRGQAHAKRALEIAASGGHSLLFIGPPGTGKTMLASRFPSILPSMTIEDALEVAAVNSISRAGFCSEQWRMRPFRSPHHTTSGVALVGGGNPPRPGEITLAHHGVLFLDELPEFNRHVLETLREPLESKTITISRASRQVSFPANFQLIAAMNPCPCGYLGASDRGCRCTPEQIQRYRNKLSGPLLDRIDMHVEMPAVSHHELMDKTEMTVECSSLVRARVENARAAQIKRQGIANAQLSNQALEKHSALDEEVSIWLQESAKKLKLSARAYHRTLKLARTIADLNESHAIAQSHLAEAMNYRILDRL